VTARWGGGLVLIAVTIYRFDRVAALEPDHVARLTVSTGSRELSHALWMFLSASLSL
jgi:hypothetical protein